VANEHDIEYMGSLFALEIEGVELGRFTGISGLGYTAEVVEYTDTLSDGKLVTRKRPGRVNYGDITLSRGLSPDNQLVEWYQSVLDGAVERKNGSIVMFDTAGDETGRWNFENAWISEWNASDLDSGGDDIVVETVTITHEFLERVS
jgi:phage tail-like protein